MTMSFTRAFETYQVRWGIEVLIKDCRRNLGFGKCQSNDFDAQVAGILRDNEVADETIFLARVLADYRRTNRSNCLTSVRHVLNVHG
jgi:hypothetical protein